MSCHFAIFILRWLIRWTYTSLSCLRITRLPPLPNSKQPLFNDWLTQAAALKWVADTNSRSPMIGWRKSSLFNDLLTQEALVFHRRPQLNHSATYQLHSHTTAINLPISNDFIVTGVVFSFLYYPHWFLVFVCYAITLTTIRLYFVQKISTNYLLNSHHSCLRPKAECYRCVQELPPLFSSLLVYHRNYHNLLWFCDC